MGPDVALVSSAEETAKDVYATLLRGKLLSPEPAAPRHEFVCSGDAASFVALGERFLGPEITEVGAATVREAAWS
jgi:glutamate racemase